MICFPPCKINLGLRILRKRADGYHDVETCFFPVPWCDVLEIIPSAATTITQTGIAIAGALTTNLVFKAYELLKHDFGIGPVKIHLHKIIPHGAGLGGGSSDAAHALKLLNTIFQLKLSVQQLSEYALKLGSDCPFFLDAKPMLGKGRGEQLEPFAVNVSGKYWVLIKPDVHVSTAEAYSNITPNNSANSLRKIIEKPIGEWRQNLVNDFELSVCSNNPEIARIKEFLYANGALYASMSGSGSTVYGIFDEPFHPAKYYPALATWSGKI